MALGSLGGIGIGPTGVFGGRGMVPRPSPSGGGGREPMNPVTNDFDPMINSLIEALLNNPEISRPLLASMGIEAPVMSTDPYGGGRLASPSTWREEQTQTQPTTPNTSAALAVDPERWAAAQAAAGGGDTTGLGGGTAPIDPVTGLPYEGPQRGYGGNQTPRGGWTAPGFQRAGFNAEGNRSRGPMFGPSGGVSDGSGGGGQGGGGIEGLLGGILGLPLQIIRMILQLLGLGGEGGGMFSNSNAGGGGGGGGGMFSGGGSTGAQVSSGGGGSSGGGCAGGVCR